MELPSIDVSNVLREEKRQQVIALGRLGRPLRRIQEETGVRRETAGACLTDLPPADERDFSGIRLRR